MKATGHITAEREFELVRIAQRDRGGPRGRQAVAALLEAHHGYLMLLVLRARVPECSREDLFQELAIALIESIHTFDADLGFRLLTYATKRLTQTIGRWHKRDHLIRLPSKDPRREQTHLRADVRRAKRLIPLEFAREGSLPPAQTLMDEEPAAPAVAEQREQLAIAVAALNALEPRHRRVIAGRVAERTLESIGRTMGVTKERIRQMETRATQVMRGFCARRGLRELTA